MQTHPGVVQNLYVGSVNKEGLQLSKRVHIGIYALCTTNNYNIIMYNVLPILCLA